MSPLERGLWAAIIADPDDDLARLVYADYLEEAGRAPLANFVRAQIHLANCPPGHPGHADAVEAQSLAVAAARGASSLPAPTLPEGVTFAGSVREIEGDNYGSYERGFPSRVTFNGLRMRTGPGEMAKALKSILQETLIRHVDLVHLPERDLRAFLHSHSASQLRGLGITPGPATAETCATILTGSTQLFNVGNLTVGNDSRIPRRDAALLYPHTWGRLANGNWSNRLKSITLGDAAMLDSLRPLLGPTVRGLTLDHLENSAVRGLEAVAANRLTGLKQLYLPRAAYNSINPKRFARLPLSPLSCLTLTNIVDTFETLTELLAAPYLEDLVELAVADLYMSPIESLARNESIRRSVRLLYLDNAIPGSDSLAALTRPGLFPALTTLSVKRSKAPNDGGLAQFAEAWRGEGLHTLILDGWPAPVSAMQKLAANPAFKSLRRLKLARCGVSDAGGVALARSPHLQNLVELDLSTNTLGEKAAALFLDTGVMPNLALADLTTNRMHPDTRTRLRASRVGVWA